ncbi:MAG TPA: hypothetical protein VG324_17340 [Blastocatellia bacterium]|nr:hypothetical protein [Blastocatellia bacterium]
MRILKTFIGMSGVVAFLAVCLVATSSLSSFAQTDPFIGTWKLNLAKSKFSPGPPPKSQTATYEAVGQGLKITVKITDAEGKQIEAQSTANFDGKDYPVTGNPDFDTVVQKRINANTIEFTRKKAGKVVSTATSVVSKDGKTRTGTEKGVNAKGEKISNTLVYEKQ